MAEIVAIVGPSGSGKSRSIITLDPKSTVVIAVDNKGLPFKGWKAKYTPLTAAKFDQGNHLVTDNWNTMCKVMQRISDERPEIKTIVIDDMQYLLAYEFMNRSSESGFTKFSEMGFHGWKPLETAKKLRDDLIVFFLYHEEDSSDANYVPKKKIKTLGKLLDDKITLEGMFRIVLFTKVVHNQKTGENSYYFTTQTDGVNTAKSPEEMFSEYEIENSLEFVRKTMKEYDLG
jgi:ABC-type oligopeptide transport system ATPase subunit